MKRREFIALLTGGRLKVRQTEHGAVSGADNAQGRKSPWSV
jgi:hypothetical protein